MFAQQQSTTETTECDEMDWSAAVCRDGTGSLTDLFFSDQLDDIAKAKALCVPCPVREPCLRGAKERREPWGVWGGQLFQNGVVLAHKRKRGRPPKVRQVVEALPA
ncbi:MAG TPA: WhiB family transcriptional regulator [Acidimicrobiales bacterium]|nr:WhiB family transcriptional regulator [Acidimicrobiales bacterium]